jgi:hypothetical protein
MVHWAYPQVSRLQAMVPVAVMVVAMKYCTLRLKKLFVEYRVSSQTVCLKMNKADLISQSVKT